MELLKIPVNISVKAWEDDGETEYFCDDCMFHSRFICRLFKEELNYNDGLNEDGACKSCIETVSNS